MAWSENVNYLCHTVHNNLIATGAINTDDSEAVQSILSSGKQQERNRVTPVQKNVKNI